MAIIVVHKERFVEIYKSLRLYDVKTLYEHIKKEEVKLFHDKKFFTVPCIAKVGIVQYKENFFTFFLDGNDGMYAKPMYIQASNVFVLAEIIEVDAYFKNFQ